MKCHMAEIRNMKILRLISFFYVGKKTCSALLPKVIIFILTLFLIIEPEFDLSLQHLIVWSVKKSWLPQNWWRLPKMKKIKLMLFLEEKTLIILCFLLEYKHSRETNCKAGAVCVDDGITWPTYH